MERFRWEFAIRLTISKVDRDQVTPRLTSKQTWRLSPSIFTSIRPCTVQFANIYNVSGGEQAQPQGLPRSMDFSR